MYRDRNTIYNCGSFSVPTIATLRSLPSASAASATTATAADTAVDNAAARSARAPPLVFEIRTAARDSMRFVDVGAVQAMPSSAGALFQVASNFNGIEGISSQAHPDRASYATDWHYDYTQGPRASIFAGAAAMARIFAPWAYPLPLMETDAPQDYATATAAAAAAGMSSDNTSGSNGRATPLPSRKQVYESVVEAAIDDDSNERAAVLFGAQGAYIPTEASAAWPAPGPRLRMYLGTPTGAALARRAAQTRGRQVQALGALAKDFPTRNGYVILPKNGHAQQQDGEADDAGGSESFPTESDADRARWEEKLGRVRVMCHRRCTVTFDSVPGQPDALRVLDAHTLVPGEDCAQVPAVVGHEIDQVR